MNLELARNWWAVALRGVLGIAFGLLVFAWPQLFWVAVVFTFAAYAIVDGAIGIVAAVTGQRQAGPWWALILEGVVSIAAGVLAIAWPDITELAMLFLIAGWCVVTGVFEIAAAVRLRKHIKEEWLLGLDGVLSILLGLALAFMPVAGLLVVAWWVGAWALVSGVLMLVLAFQLRSLARHAPRHEYVAVH